MEKIKKTLRLLVGEKLAHSKSAGKESKWRNIIIKQIKTQKNKSAIFDAVEFHTSYINLMQTNK